ncbi:NAD(+) diphosphatase [Microbacterium sediminicola]|uniref:NAD(+) diphosphatase n=1 Tax=Microbacterium sediminicola TaxID=415210 RepID=A0ABN2HMZ6_9MICO
MQSSGRAPLARSGLDRAEHRRTDVGTDPAPDARVLVVDADRAPMDAAGRLLWVSASDPALAALDGIHAFLGEGADGRDLWLLALPDGAEAPDIAARWEALRAVGGGLVDLDASAFVAALSLARWLRDSPYCPACGAVTTLTTGGWARSCGACGREHFPRTDPAVIVAVTDPTGERILLGSNAAWGADRYSCFAGFVEAGESLESAVAREVLEESGVHVEELTYLGSQAWPYPRSLMLGFIATTSDAVPRPDGEEIIDARWFDREQIAAALAGDALPHLPGPASIARTLIEHWHAAERAGAA